MNSPENLTNPFHICTKDDSSDCAACGIQGKLTCKFDTKVKNAFTSAGMPAALIPLMGFILIGLFSGSWWILAAYLAYFLIMFNVFEIRFLCSHCPYYADHHKTLKCPGNYGSPKLWKYHPEPMNRFEKLMMRFSILGMIFFILPLTGLGYGIVYLAVNYSEFGLIPLAGMAALAVGSLVTSLSFVSVLNTFYCSNCVNFSCPYNTVSKVVVDEYLRKNKVMKEAWERSGYVLDEPVKHFSHN
jgi:hypothetical protein